jgi:diguanylate cyclase (GGDEF)-like protein
VWSSWLGWKVMQSRKDLETLRVFGIFPGDELRLIKVRTALAQVVDTIVPAFYDHLYSLPEAAKYFTGTEGMTRLIGAQKEYLLSIGDFRQEDPATVTAYFERRIRVGLTHYRVGLPPKLYMGAYGLLGQLAMDQIALSVGTQHLSSLHKVLALDAHLAVESYEQAQRIAILEDAARDDLCGISARKAVIESLRTELARARRFGHPLSVLFQDVDFFKSFNDTHGHAIGDEVLRAVSAAIRSCVRPMDIVGRYSGDEFIVGIVETDGEGALAVAERINAAVAGLAFGKLPVTLSMGIATLKPTETLEELVTRADQAMYEAKRLGRGRIHLCSGQPVEYLELGLG